MTSCLIDSIHCTHHVHIYVGCLIHLELGTPQCRGSAIGPLPGAFPRWDMIGPGSTLKVILTIDDDSLDNQKKCGEHSENAQ